MRDFYDRVEFYRGLGIGKNEDGYFVCYLDHTPNIKYLHKDGNMRRRWPMAEYHDSIESARQLIDSYVEPFEFITEEEFKV